ncbi:MAG: acyl-CoA dehydratase activase-related protein [Planctomycetota bacterium]|jgi:predicted nucleotide-binding protein (sugar kinase/HSP70/actin superfamily)/activator of 2-hydroxyglutaryl-CoA dehydratase
MNPCLGIHVGYDAVAVSLTEADGRVLASAGPESSAGAPLRTLARLLESAGIDLDRVERALATGVGSGLVARELGVAETSVAAAAARAARVLAPGTRSALVAGLEEALLVQVSDVGVLDVRHAGPCGMGVGRLLARWCPPGAASLPAPSDDACVSTSCALAADEDLERLWLGGAGGERVAAHAVRVAARILAGNLLRGRGVEGPVALIGPAARTPALAAELSRALGLADGSVTVPGRAEAGLAVGAALLASAVGRRPVVPADWPPRSPGPAAVADDTGVDHDTATREGGISIAYGVHVSATEARAVGLDTGGRVVAGSCVAIAEAGAASAARSALDDLGAKTDANSVTVTGEEAEAVASAIGDDASVMSRSSALARFAAREGGTFALDVGARESVLVRLEEDGSPADAEYPSPCGRGLGQALVEVARGLGLADARALGRLAAGSERGSWLRDRCAGTIRRDAATAVASGTAPGDVARGALDAVARASRRRLAEKWAPRDGALPQGMLLTGPLACVAGFADAVSRAFGREATPAPHAHYALAVGAAFEPAALEATTPGDAPAAGEPGAAMAPDGLLELERLRCEHMSRRALGKRIARMGLPLSLMDGARAVYWSRFLAELGFDVVLADAHARPSPRARGAGEPCRPAAGLRAEAAELAASGVDAVFVPVEVDAPAGTDAGGAPRGIVYRCPFLQAGAHLVPPDVARVVRPVRFGALPEHLALTSLVDSLSPWRIARGAVEVALARADSARQSYERDLASRAEAFKEALCESSRALVLLGREYGERLLSAGARASLTDGGVALLPQEFILAGLPPDDEDALAAAREMHWESGRRILTAARKVARDDRFAAVYVTHARCGPDSFVMKYAREILAGRPWTRLELVPDLNGRPAEDRRVVERCGAFREAWDARRASGRTRERRDFPEHPEPPRREGPPPLIRFPDMGVASAAGVAALEGFDIPAEVVRADEESLRAGARLTSGDECLPYIVTIGNLAKTVAAEGFDPARSAFFMATSSGACRFGQYRRGFRQVLDALGHDDVRVISLNQSEGKTKQMPGLAFGMLLWKGMTALGALEEIAFHLRPRAADPERADRALTDSREDVLASLRARRNPAAALARSGRRLRAVDVDPGRLPVSIALTGEIFARSQPFSNSDVVRLVEEAGGEVVAPPFQEWLHHVGRCVWLFARARGDGMAQLKLRLVRGFLRRGEERARRTLRRAGAPVPPEQPAIEEVWRASREAGFVPWFGDASLALGRAIVLGRRGAKGVVNIVPYGCLPGTTAEAVFAARREAIGRMPVLHLSLDGGPAAEVRSRVLDIVEAAHHYSTPPPPPAPKRARFIRPVIRRFWVRD